MRRLGAILRIVEFRLVPSAPPPASTVYAGSSHAASTSSHAARSAPGHRPGSLLAALDYWHLLSLDAPTVAVTWLLCLAWCAGVPAGKGTPVALFLAVWALYAGDRMLDARLLSRPARPEAPARAELERRHFFHHEHKAGFTRALCVVLPLLGWCMLRLPRPVLQAEVLLAALLLGWLLLIHGGAPHRPQRLPKELPVGFFFAAAVCLPTLTARPGLWRPVLPAALLFACVCLLNCLFLYDWEHAHDHTQAHPATRWALGHLETLTGATLLLSLIATAAALHAFPVRVALPPAACALSTALLLLLSRLRGRLAPVRLRALADLVLLTPVLLRVCVAWH